MYSTERMPFYDEYLERNVDASDFDAGRTSPNKVHRLRPGASPRSRGFKNTQVASGRPSITRRIIRVIGRFSVAALIGIGATLAWQSYGGEMVRTWAPSLDWLVPVSPTAQLQALLKPVALDLAIMKRSVEQLGANQDQLARKQDQMAQALAALQVAEQDIKQTILAVAPLAPKAAHVPPPKPSQAAVQ
jgi:hypothetical protein